MLSRSKSKRWVIYERHGLPCLIDTATMTEELLGFGSEARMMCAYGNTEIAPTVKWHPKKDRAAMEIIVHRKFTTLWTWTHGKGLRQFGYEGMIKALGYKKDAIAGGAGFFTEGGVWNGEDLDFGLTFCVIKGDAAIDHTAKLRWNSDTDKLTVLSDKVMP